MNHDIKVMGYFSIALYALFIGAKIFGFTTIPWLVVLTSIIWIPVAVFFAYLIGPAL